MRTPKELFSAIVELSKSFSNSEEVKEEVEVSADEVVQEEVKLEEDMPKEEPMEAPQPSWVSKAEFEEALKEMKEMYSKVLEVISPSKEDEVPATLTAEEIKNAPVVDLTDVKEELSEQKEEVELSEEEKNDSLVHDPEGMVEKKKTILYGQGRIKTTQDYVFESIFKNK